MTRFAFRLVALVVLGVLAVGACGDDDPTTEEADTTAGPTSSADPTGAGADEPAPLDGVTVAVTLVWDGPRLVATATATSGRDDPVGLLPFERAMAEVDGDTYRFTNPLASAVGGDDGTPPLDAVVLAAGATHTFEPQVVQQLGPQIARLEVCLGGAPLADDVEAPATGSTSTVPLSVDADGGGVACSTPVLVPAEE